MYVVLNTIVVSVQTQELNATHQWSVRMDDLAKENGRLQIEIQNAREECQLAEAQVGR